MTVCRSETGGVSLWVGAFSENVEAAGNGSFISASEAAEGGAKTVLSSVPKKPPSVPIGCFSALVALSKIAVSSSSSSQPSPCSRVARGDDLGVGAGGQQGRSMRDVKHYKRRKRWLS